MNNDTIPDRQPVILLRNYSYPTYQLYAIAGKGKSTSPDNVLKITVLETMKWLRQRFRAFELPEELKMPEPDDYEAFDLLSLHSFYLDMGYKLQVIWLADRGIWTLQLTEPDMGASPGAAVQERMPVPGRLFETNVSYNRIADGVECGFKTVVHEPKGTEGFCEVFRPAFTKYLARNPKVGLWHTWQLLDEAHLLSGSAVMKCLKKWLSAPDRMMPAVIFSEYASVPETSPICMFHMDMPSIYDPDRALCRSLGLSIPAQTEKQMLDPAVPLDFTSLTRYRMGYAQFFILPASNREEFTNIVGQQIGNGEILIIEPSAFGRKITVLPFNRIMREPESVLQELDIFVQNYPKGKPMTFGKCVFRPEALDLQGEDLLKLYHSKEEMAKSFLIYKSEMESQFNKKLADIAEELNDSEKRNERFRAKFVELENEKKLILECAEVTETRHKIQMTEKDSQIEHFKMLQHRPKKPSEVAMWIEQCFGERLIFHERAKAMMGKVQPNDVDMSLLCDALEYLAIEYRNELVGQIDETARNTMCSNKYGRPFLVVPTKSISVEMYPANYKIKYNIGHTGKPVESLLNLHLKVGNDSSNLLRIYFLYDKEKKIIVVGSLPKHLKIQSYR